MKTEMNIIKMFAYAGVLSLALSACDDEFEGSSFVTPTDEENKMTCTTLMESHEEDFSLWLELLKYADYYNGLKDASSTSTVFAPTNKAIREFLEWRGVSSIEELDRDYARSVVQVHILNGVKLDCDNLVNSANDGTQLTYQNLFFDYLKPSYGYVNTDIDDAYRNDDVEMAEVLFLNNQAAVQPRDSGGINYLTASNSIIYYMDDVIHPLVETIVDKLEQQEGEGNTYTIFAQACRESGYDKVLSKVRDTIRIQGGGTSIISYNYTCFAPTDKAMAEAGINSLADLKSKVGSDQGLYDYCAYHCINQAYTKDEFLKFETDNEVLIYDTNLKGQVVIGQNTFNEDSTTVIGTIINEKAHILRSNIQARNGYIHKIDYWMPVWTPAPVAVRWDFLNTPEIIAYVNAWGASNKQGEFFYGSMSSSNRQIDLSDNCLDGDFGVTTLDSTLLYEYKDTRCSTRSYRRVGYMKTRYVSSRDHDNNPYNAYHNDLLVLNLGYAGWFQMQTPTIIKGKYRVTLHYGVNLTFLTAYKESAGSPVKFQFDPEEDRSDYSKNAYVYKGLYGNVKTAQSSDDLEIFKTIEFETSKTHTFKATMLDIKAKTNNSYHMLWDYILFEPINE